MTTRREFLGRGAAVAAAAAVAPMTAAAQAVGPEAIVGDVDEERRRAAERLRAELKRYTTIAAAGQAVPAAE